MDERSARWLLFIGGLIAALLLVLIVLLLSDDGSEEMAADSSTSTTAAATTTTADPTTTAPATTAAPGTTEPKAILAGRCAGFPAGELPADAADITQAPGNFDGEPQPESVMEADQAIVYSSGGVWWVGLLLWPDGFLSVEIPEPTLEDFTPSLHGVVNFGDADDGALVHVDQSGAASAAIYHFYRLTEDCQVDAAGTMDVETLEFIHGGGAAHAEGFSCVEDGVFENTAGASEGGLWNLTSTFYAWDPLGPGFEFGFVDGQEVPEDDPAIGFVSTVDC